MKRLVLLIVYFLIVGCAKRDVKLPTLAEKGVQEIHNHSQVWLFFELENNDTTVIVNRKNTISTTHWIFNIDKRLPLRTILPSIIELQDKHANSIHSKEGMHNYYSYADTISKKLSFLEFDNVIYQTDSILSKYYLKTNSEKYLNYFNINLTFNAENVWVNDVKIERSAFKSTLLEFIDFSSEGKQTMLHLNFNQNNFYQDYLYYKTLIFSLNNEFIITNPIEFIFDPNKVPDCGC
jgi:hypothetical protein